LASRETPDAARGHISTRDWRAGLLSGMSLLSAIPHLRYCRGPDLTASILAATGAPVPENARLEGINLFPVLAGTAPEVERTLFWRNVTPHAQRAVRHGDWKLLVDGGPNGPELLFNLRQDVGERHDMAKERQDIARTLRPLIAAWEADVDAEAHVGEQRVASPPDPR
jgi:arylsulfatase A-like enzyme